MRFIWTHIEHVVNDYKCEQPLSIYLKEYYKQHRKLGSRDRKMLSEMAYSWYRYSRAVPSELSFEEKVASCLKACNTSNKHLLILIEPYGVESHNVVNDDLFSKNISFSGGMSRADWLQSMLEQPRLFLRVRKDKDRIIEVLEDEDVDYSFLSENILSLPNGTPVDRWFPEYVYVVQDASSQLVGDFFEAKPYELWWDACSGAGGKSLMLKDIEPLVDVVATDKRKSVLNNLKERFRAYSQILHKSLVLNLNDEQKLSQTFEEKQFDNIICDVPCTGSGTWARTPEQMFFFKEEELTRFTELQYSIVKNASKYLKSGGSLYYITCSVFEPENEFTVKRVSEELGLKIHTQQLINGVAQYADSMFVAVLKKK